MFESHDRGAVEQLERLIHWMKKRVSEAEARDPQLRQLKRDESEAAARLDASLPEAEQVRLIEEHNRTVTALVEYISSKK
jgi:hypothetical protein